MSTSKRVELMNKNSQETRIALLEQSQLYIIDTLKEIKAEIRDLRTEIKDFRTEINERFKKIDEKFEKVNDRFDKIMHWLLGTIGFGIFTILANFALRYYFNV